MRLDISETIQRSIYLGTYEGLQTQWMRACLDDGSRFVDVGANFGYYTILASTLVGENGQIYAFEPSAKATAVIHDAITLNHLRNVTVVCSAVGRDAGEVDLLVPVNPDLYSPSLFDSGAVSERVRVPVITLDSFEPLRSGPPIDLIKIDAEGSEPDIIEGMKTLAREGMIRNIFCELNSGWLKRNNTTPGELLTLILDLGFQVHRSTEEVSGEERPGGDLFTVQDVWFRRA